MSQKRPAIPKEVRDEVMNEYNHLCSICGEKCPQLHHIDENRDNNDPLNLLPLCPSHHLTDQHNPTSKIEIGILQLFRRYKDPTILGPQFEPLYRRLTFVEALARDENGLEEPEVLRDNMRRLLSFVSKLSMGSYYIEEIAAILDPLIDDGRTTRIYGRL